jgi:hypothetical protein
MQQTPNSPHSEQVEQLTPGFAEDSAARTATGATATTTEPTASTGTTNAAPATGQKAAAVLPVSGQELSTALAEAEQIILYTARHGIEVPKEILKAIACARKRLPARLSEDELIKFWQSVSALARLVQPVTINSISSTGSAAAIAWSIFSMLLLVLLITTQIIWVLGTNATSELDNSWKAFLDARSDFDANTRRLQTSMLTGTEADQFERLSDQVEKSKAVKLQRGWEHEAASVLLARWANSVPTAWEWRAGELSYETQQQLVLSSAKATLKAMSAYVLPLLYGLLGATAYVMRSLSKEISEVTFSHVSNIRFILRLVIGMLSGISVGLILTQDTLPTTLSAITPLALAFLAGYSVELLFAAMDRLISAFSSEGTRSTAK